ncbi:hypothetical protein COI73_17925 [Bacillus cereus]|nr:hypothetical protein COI73_17925 [Bacillus cereus]
MKKIIVSLLSIFIFFSAFSTNAFAAAPKYVAGHHGYWDTVRGGENGHFFLAMGMQQKMLGCKVKMK